MRERQGDIGCVVRGRRTGDITACAAASVTVHESDQYPVEGVADPVAWLTPANMLEAWVAELNSHIVGHVAISTPQDDDAAPALWMQKTPGRAGGIAVLGRLFVLPSARGHMVGERLVQAAVAAAERRGLRTVLDVMAKDSAAIRLYERLGWQFIGATEHEFDGGQTTPAYCYVAPFP